MPNLVIVSRALAPYRVRYYRETAVNLAAAGWKVTLIVARKGAFDHPWKDVGSGDSFLEIVAGNGGTVPLFWKPLARCAPKGSPVPTTELMRLLEELDPEIVWAHEYSPFCLAASWWAYRKERLSILSTELGDAPPEYACDPRHLTFQKAMGFLYQAVIGHTPESTRRKHPPQGRVHFSPHAIDTAEYRPKEKEGPRTFRFLFTGVLDRRKGLDSLVNACRILWENGWRFDLRVVGAGPLTEWLGGLQEPWLSIAGFREGSELIEEYRDADAYVLPTRADTYAVSVHEAAACELPLIIGKTAGSVETLVDEEISGFAIDPENPQEIADRMAALLDDPDLIRAMGNEARARATAYDVKALGRSTARFLLHQYHGHDPAPLRRAAIETIADRSQSSRIEAVSVAAIFCTMNRSGTAAECLRLLAAQSVLPGKIFVTDNASTDDTLPVLESLAPRLGIPFHLISSPANVGNAGGVKLAVEMAFAEGFRHVWIMDDDSWPESTAFENLIDPEGPSEGIRTSLVLAPNSDQVSWPCEITTGAENWRNLGSFDEVREHLWVKVRRSWLGALVSREAYDRAGPIDADLFLRGEDEEYPRALENAGYRFWMSPRSVLRHPVAGPLVTLSFGENKLCLERNLGGDKLYYRIRNMLWIKNRETGKGALMLLAGGYFILILRWFRPLGPNLRTFFEAASDALTGRLGQRPGSRESD